MRTFRRYVAIGDSTTEGLDDPDGAGGYRGWADRLAEIIADAQTEPLSYANLGVRSLYLSEIRATQFDAAMAMQPDLLSIFGGANDTLSVACDFAAIRADLAAIFGEARSRDCTVVTFTMPDLSPINPFGKRLRGRILQFNDIIREEAERSGVLVMDFLQHPIIQDPRLFSEDRLHASELGHERLAAALAWRLGIDGADKSWADPFPEEPPRLRTREQLVADVEWARRYLAPWLSRGLRRHPRNSGLTAKRPVLMPVRHQDRKAGSLLLNPHTYDPSHFDDATASLLRATIDWFEHRGKETLLRDYRECVWYADFLEFVAKEQLFAKLGTPAREANGDPDKRWDTSRISAFSEILAFYGLDYWYAWQVSILGLGPIWQSDNAEARREAAQWLDDGAVFAYGLSEREHGADIYTTDMVLTPDGAGGFRATGGKYYIGNGNVARMISVFGRRSDVDGPDGYVFFTADSQHENYRLVKNVVQAQMYVSEFRLENYPVRAKDVLHTGQAAFDAALNTVNIGKFNIGFASIGMSEHAMYEAVTHAHSRVLYGKRVTDFPHVRRSFVDAYARLIAIKAFGNRAIDYFRSASPQDRRYLLFNPVTKMKMTTEGEKVIGLLWDVIAAKGYERDTYFRGAGKDVGALARLEGTVHVNLALTVKFIPNYLFAPTEQPPVPTRHGPVDDEFLFRQGPARGLGKITFADWRLAFEPFAGRPNVALFSEQAEGFTTLLRIAAPDAEQQQDLDFGLVLGQLFTLIVYAQLILEQARLTGLDPDVLDTIFGILVRDFSALAVELHGKASSTEAQQQWAVANVRKPVIDEGRFQRVWEQVVALSGAYEMSP